MDEQGLVRGMNWAPNSSDEEEDDQITPTPTPWKNDVADAMEEAVTDTIAMEEAVVAAVDSQVAEDDSIVMEEADVDAIVMKYANFTSRSIFALSLCWLDIYEWKDANFTIKRAISILIESRPSNHS